MRETSHEARRSIAGRVETDRERILLHVYDMGVWGQTDEEIQEALGMNPSTERPRRGELVKSGALKASGITRLTRSGRRAIVWRHRHAI